MGTKLLSDKDIVRRRPIHHAPRIHERSLSSFGRSESGKSIATRTNSGLSDEKDVSRRIKERERSVTGTVSQRVVPRAYEGVP